MKARSILPDGLPFRVRSPALALPIAVFLAAVWPVAPSARGDEAPLIDSVEEEMPGERFRRTWAADQALRFGFSPVAIDIYRSELTAAEEGDPDLPEIRLGLAAAYLTERRFADAEQVLSEYPSEDDARYILRRAAIALGQRDHEAFAERVPQIQTDDLPVEERGWGYFLQAILRNREGNSGSAQELYERALESSPTAEQVAAFSLAWQRARLVEGEADEAMAEELQRQMEEFQGRTAGYRFAQQYAVVLEQLGQRSEASSVTRAQLQSIPSGERELRDEFLLLDGLIAGPDSGQGRSSLRQLLEDGENRDLQRIALRTLTATVADDGWEDFDGFLGRLVEAEHQLVEEILVFRAQVALRGGASEEGDDRAQRLETAIPAAQDLLTRFPGSQYKQEALEVLAAAAWEQRRYRTAANHLSELRGELGPGRRRSQLGLLVADCYFRAGEVNRSTEDFRNAADAYGSVLRELPDHVPEERILFQRVMAEINGGRVDRAGGHLEGVPPGDSVHRWRAEWNLVKAMQRRGEMENAYGRINTLLEGESGGVPEEALRLRLLWLQAQLSHDAGRSEETVPLLDSLQESLEKEEAAEALGERMLGRVKAHSLLLRGQAFLSLGRDEEAIATLESIRSEHEGSEPAIYSYLVEARHYMQVNRIVDAQQLLIQLADNHRDSSYAAIALYEAALNSQRRGPEESYQQQAISLLERMVNEHPGHELAFYARLRQGDLLRQLNRFEAAELVYRDLSNTHSNHPDVALVQLSLADCYLAQVGNEEGARFSNAVAILERLFDLPALPADLRAEAGFKLAFASARRANGSRERVGELYWAVVSNLFLDENVASSIGSRGRYWIARSLLEYGRHFEEIGRKDEATRAYEMITENGLPGEALAAANLARLLVE